MTGHYQEDEFFFRSFSNLKSLIDVYANQYHDPQFWCSCERLQALAEGACEGFEWNVPSYWLKAHPETGVAYCNLKQFVLAGFVYPEG